MMRPVLITTLVIVASGVVRIYDLVVAMTGGGPGLSSQVPDHLRLRVHVRAPTWRKARRLHHHAARHGAIIVIPWVYREFGSGGG